MRVCHVITKPELGGAQLSTLNILSGLSKVKYDVSCVTSPKGILRPEFQNLENIKTIFSPFLKRPINPLYDILAFIHIYYIYRRDKYHIVHTHSSKAGIIGRLAAWLARTPVIVHTVHGWSFNEYQNLIIKRLFILLERVTAVFTTKIICVSKQDIQTGIKYNIASENKFIFIKYGIPLLGFRKTATDSVRKRKELGINDNGPVVGMISCLKPQKSPLDYIKAAVAIHKKIPDVNFLLVGDGVLREKCKELLTTTPLNGRFIFTGWRRDIPEILDILDIMVLTSKWEGMPIAVIEALCKGCPVVATDAGGTRELIKDGISGYLTKPGSHHEIASRIGEVLENPERLNVMKKEAFLSIDDSFSVDRMINEVEALYRSLI